jgi:hypothetical protein
MVTTLARLCKYVDVPKDKATHEVINLQYGQDFLEMPPQACSLLILHSIFAPADYLAEKLSAWRKALVISQAEITRVIVEHKDRLTRFNFGVYERYFHSHGVTIEYAEDAQNKTYEQELVDDMISLMSSFSAKIYGKRSREQEASKGRKISGRG